MTHFRMRLSTLLWLVALVAVFLAGIRFGEHREAARRRASTGLRTFLSYPAGSGYKPLPAPDTLGTPP